jgi:hypothetical protein
VKEIISVVALFPTMGALFAQTYSTKADHTITKEISLPTQKEVGKKTLAGSYIFIVELDGSVKEVTGLDLVSVSKWVHRVNDRDFRKYRHKYRFQITS